MTFSTQDITKKCASLPASLIADDVNSTLQTHNSLVITAPPGAGKSTLLPLTILSSLGDGEKILMLEPRRLAARQIAERMAQILGETVGETVGYRVRFESKVSKRTRIEVLTEGILTRMLVDDATLDGVSIVIFDEFHERSINSDLALALTRQAQEIIRPDLKIVIMSATIDACGICAALKAPLIESEGRMFPVELHYADEDTDPRDIAAVAASTTIEAYKKHEGDILVFLPGQAEIERCFELLSNSQHLTTSGGALVSSAPTNLTTSPSQHITTSPSHHLTLTYGEIDTTKEKKKAEEPNIFTPHVENILLPMKTYASTVEFKQSNKSRDFINDEADDEQAEQQSYIKTGLLLHYLFSNIETADNVDRCLHDMEMEGLFDESVITPNKLKNMLHKRFSNPKVKEWFGGGWTLFNECSILSYDPHTDKLTEHRPDRVMKRGDEVQIVDFKFGKPQPEHTDQVRRYISLTHNMGYTDVKGYLWYVYSDNIVEV